MQPATAGGWDGMLIGAVGSEWCAHTHGVRTAWPVLRQQGASYGTGFGPVSPA